MKTHDREKFIFEALARLKKYGVVEIAIDTVENVLYQVKDIDEKAIEEIYIITKDEIDWKNPIDSFEKIIDTKRTPRPWEWHVE